MVRAGAAGNADGNLEEFSVVTTLSEIIFPHRTAGGEDRPTDLVGTVGAGESRTRLLNAGIDTEGRTGGERGDIEDLPAGGELGAERPQETGAIERQILNGAQREDVRDVKCGRPLVERGMARILWQRLQHGIGCS